MRRLANGTVVAGTSGLLAALVLAATRQPPGRAASILRQPVALEVALVVIAVTSVLVATEPADPE
jgi:hypothetical protein